ncbi:hypothetical protein LSTR_LSTR012111 [Laodelphax striatellus]|uniref:BTB domain-containing protein n=1 Tax=Laodelphax striatellus TaxID=195883 RepID=A0A482WXS6_LAOST|nr:hypothetical protein LSTR_LSTR012111 [Laodelphax striatellus]
MSSTSSSQRFCLRWNNHQSNLLSVFDQLLHDESFVDVTLAVEGQLLKAHKMILSACSPYFQTLFVGHPDKHPIVILKDVPYADMRSLLDFMYRGEVSVDQDRLTAFLKVAESLRIKGLTEVNEERCDIPSIASSLLHSSPTPTNHHPPPHLHRIHHGGGKRGLPPMAANPLLGSALTAPKRKRGRPRKLSGGGGGDRMDRGDSEQLDHQEVNQLVTQQAGNEGNSPPHNRSDSPLLHHATQPELLEVNMSEYPSLAPPPPPPPPPTTPPPSSSPPPPPPPPATANATTRQRDDDDDDDLPATAADHHLSNIIIKEEQMEPGPSTSINDTSRDFKPGSQDGERFMTPDGSEEDGRSSVSLALCDEITITVDTSSGVAHDCSYSFLDESEEMDDGSVICKWCGEWLPSRTHWYRHKYKLHMSQPPSTANLIKCHKCNVFFKSRKGYVGHVTARHSTASNGNSADEATADDQGKGGNLDGSGKNGANCLKSAGKRNFRGSSDELNTTSVEAYEKQREREEKLVADIIDRVKRECEAQGSTVSRRGYSRRTTVMNS